VKTYCEINLNPVYSREKDLLSAFCFAMGCLGTSEDVPFEQKSLKYRPTILEDHSKQMVVYFSSRPNEDFFLKLQQGFPHVQASISELETQDWLANWKENFKPFLFADPYWIVPSWHEAPKVARRFFRIDPGMAFGTGTHETTQMAAELILCVYRSQKHPKSVLDVGTGTGVLAMLASSLGAEKVLGIDIDPECLRVSRENIALNYFENIVFSARPIEKISEKFDLVVANIVSGVLLDLKPSLIRAIEPGGGIILTGVLKEEEKEFCENFFAHTGLKLIATRTKGDWVSFYASLLA